MAGGRRSPLRRRACASVAAGSVSPQPRLLPTPSAARVCGNGFEPRGPPRSRRRGRAGERGGARSPSVKAMGRLRRLDQRERQVRRHPASVLGLAGAKLEATLRRPVAGCEPPDMQDTSGEVLEVLGGGGAVGAALTGPMPARSRSAALIYHVGRVRISRGIIRGAKWNELGWTHVARDDSRATAGAGRGSVRRNAATF
jgi:hypothetical protein